MRDHHDQFVQNVSVIVLNYNHGQMTLECVQALHNAASPLIREVIVVDNGSRVEEVALLRSGSRESGFALVEVGENRFFGEGNNIGVDAASGDFLVFLNNDAFVQPGWIEALAQTMKDDPTVAACGPMFLYPDGRVQEVGGVALPTGDVVQVGKGSVWGADHYDTPCPVDFCSAACLMVRRADFLRVGGFGFEWEPAYYEDVDLCLKLWTQCGKVVVNPRARVVHVESQTTSTVSLQLHDISEINRFRFVEKWGRWLESRQTRHLAEEPPAAALAPGPLPEPQPVHRPQHGTPRFVLYSPYQMVPGGGERVLFELAAYFASLSSASDVAFTTPSRYSTLRIRQIADTFGFAHNVGGPLPWDSLDTTRCRLAVVLGNSITPPIPAFGEHCVYQLQFPFYIPDEEVEETASRFAGYEEIWVYSEFVKRHVNGLVKHYGLDAPPIRVITPPATWVGATSGQPWSTRRTVLCVGRFFAGGHNKRQDVVVDAFRKIVAAGFDDLELALAGSIHPSPAGRQRFHELQSMASDLDCRFYPNASRADLAALYERSAVLVHAAGYGVDPDEIPQALEHFGITPVEAASFGCIPVVYDQGGLPETVKILGSNTTFSTVDECAQVVADLLRQPSASEHLSSVVRTNSQVFSPEVFRVRVGRALEDLGVLE